MSLPILLAQFEGSGGTAAILLVMAMFLAMVFIGFVLLMLWLWVWLYERRPFVTLGFPAGHIASKIALGVMPSQENIVLERFFDDSGSMQLIIHAPFGSRLNRAWGLALRKRFCRKLRSPNLERDLLALRLAFRPDDFSCVKERLATYL